MEEYLPKALITLNGFYGEAPVSTKISSAAADEIFVLIS
jgi:hypothetical protein